MPQTQTPLTANARAVLAEGETLTQAQWETDDQGVAGLLGASIDDEASSCTILNSIGGFATVRCQLTTSTGRKLPQYFEVDVGDSPFADGTAYGSQSITVSNP